MKAFKDLYDTIVTLRSPNGCKWDKEQTPSSLRGALIEETYECLEAIDEDDPAHIAEELGDLYLLVTMICYMHEQEGKFSVADALQKVNEKLIRRHPHVFGDIKVKDTKEILKNWDKIKTEQEGRKPKDSILDEVSSALPPMDRAFKLQKKAAKVGFDWPNTEGVIEKIKEELNEVREVIKYEGQGIDVSSLSVYISNSDNEQSLPVPCLEEELGDLLFSVINLCRFLKIEPSVALRRTNTKFANRFKFVESKMKETNQEMKQENLDIMEKYWCESKGVEHGKGT